MAKKRTTELIDNIKTAERKRSEHISDITNKLETLRDQAKAATEKLTEATASEDISSYSTAKNDLQMTETAISMYEARLKYLTSSPLFDDVNTVIDRIGTAQKDVELAALKELMPLLDKVYLIAERAKDEINEIGELLPIVLINSGIHTSAYIPSKLNGVLFSVADLQHEKPVENWRNMNR